MKLIVAEKATAASDIASALGGFNKSNNVYERSDMIIASASGHLCQFAIKKEQDTGRKNLSALPVLPQPFIIEPTGSAREKKMLNHLGTLLKRPDVDVVVNACDAGREGELIFRLVYEFHRCNKPVKRLWMQSMTKEGILNAFKKLEPGARYDSLSDAAKARSQADWLVGINASRALSLTKQLKTMAYANVRAGRVQTPTLALVVQREREIKNFVPQPYWVIEATFSAGQGHYTGTWYENESKRNRFDDESEAASVLSAINASAPQGVATDFVKQKSTPPPLLFDLTALQKEANKKYKFTAKQTLDCVQVLYEKHKAVSYPRTNSQRLPEDYPSEVKKILGCFADAQGPFKEHAMAALNDHGVDESNKRIFDNSLVDDHYAIIPTGQPPSAITDNEAKIYAMIVRRFLAAFHPPQIVSVTKRSTEVGGHLFASTGNVTIQEGWREVIPLERDKEPLCALPGGSPGSVELEAIHTTKKMTQPPARYTDASLLDAMEHAGRTVDDEKLRQSLKERGLGTPATRASIIEGLCRRSKYAEPYLLRKKNQFIPNEGAYELIDLLDELAINELVSAETTGHWEMQLNEIQKGAMSATQFMSDITTLTHQIIDKVKGKAQTLAPNTGRTVGQCPKPGCDGDVQEQIGSYACSSCDFQLNKTVASRVIDSEEIVELLQHGKTKTLTGFTSKKGKSFDAALALKEDWSGISFVFEDSGSSRAPAESAELACPDCTKDLQIAKGDNPRLTCSCGFTLWLKVAGKMLSKHDAATLIKEGRLPNVTGLKKRSGGTFKASLVLLPGGKINFNFD